MSGQRARSAVAADHRSALPRVPGIPWWGALLLAATTSAVGFAYDAGSGNKELSGVFSICFVAGCLLAVLAVRQSGIFTAVIQPPLILFGIVPAAYFVFHGSTITGIKDVLINCGYPLIERFPLMFFTSAAVLVIGLVRWYLAAAARRAAPKDAETPDPAASKLATAETTTIDAVEATPRRRRREHSLDRPSRAAATAAVPEEAPRRPRKTTRPSPAGSSRSRHALPPDAELAEPSPSRRRRPGPPVDPPLDPPADARRRARGASPREPRRNLPPVDARGGPERPERPERRERPRPTEQSDRYERPERRRRPAAREPYEPYDPFEPRPTNGASGTHHPVSRVRYRGADDDGESRSEHRTRPRRPNNSDADSWGYDI